MTRQPLHLIHPKYRPDIDGLRAIAVLSVVAFHAFPNWMKGGFIGVDVFFVISGYLISTILFQSLDNNKFSFTVFYARRIKRIFPALILVFVASYIFGWFTLLADEYKQLGKHIAAGASFISNFILWSESGYFDNSTETKPLLHLWSLGIEEQFYIIWPLFLWVAWKVKFNRILLIIIFLIASLYLNLTTIDKDPTATFYSPLTRFWELLSGSLLAWFTLKKGSIHSKIHSWPNKYREKASSSEPSHNLLNLVSFLGFSLLIYGFLQINKDVSFPGVWAVIPVFGAILLILAGPESWVNKNILSNKIAVWFGLISFPLYLWHWPLLSFARIIQSETPSRSIRIAAVLLSIILAWLTYRFVERPIRHDGGKKYKLSILIFLMILIGYAGFNSYQRDGFKFRSEIKNLNAINSEFVGPLWKYSKNDICQRNYPFEDAKTYGWWFCMSSSEEKPTLLLLGNSYANHFYPGIVSNPRLGHHSVLSIGACGAEWVENSKLPIEENAFPCSGKKPLKQLEYINNIIANEKSIKYVIIGGLSKTPNREYIENLKRRIDFLESQKKTVILFTPHMQINYDIKGCYARPLLSPKQDCIIPLKEYDDLKSNFQILVDSINTTNPRVLIFDQNILFCDKERCNFKLPYMPAFRDEYAHLSEFASALLFEKFTKWAETEIPEILR